MIASLGSSRMTSPHVYDKAKYHVETVEAHGLPEEHASNHTVLFLRWLIEHDLMSKWFVEEIGGDFEQYRAGKKSIYDLYNDWWDGCLVDDMLSEEGNAFAMEYFDFENGESLSTRQKTLRKQTKSLQRRERRKCANSCREQMQQHQSTASPKPHYDVDVC